MSYAAAKAGVVQLTRDLGVHLARSGVRVNAVLFGPIDTPGQRASSSATPGRWTSHWCTGRWAGSAPWPKRPEPIAFLASDDAGFITAAALPLDGGITEAFTVPEYAGPCAAHRLDEPIQDAVQEPFELDGQVGGGQAALCHGGGEPRILPGGEQFGQARGLGRVGNRGRPADELGAYHSGHEPVDQAERLQPGTGAQPGRLQRAQREFQHGQDGGP